MSAPSSRVRNWAPRQSQVDHASLSVAAGIAQNLPTEQAMHLLAVVHTQCPLCIDFEDFPANDPGAECNANNLITQQV